MNKFLKVMFIVLIIAMTGAMIFQIFFPEVMGSHSDTELRSVGKGKSDFGI